MSKRSLFIVELMSDLQQRWQEHDPFNRTPLNEEEQDFSDQWRHAIQDSQNAAFQFDAQDLVARFVRCYPNLVPLMKRELLWFLGGECLHYLGDEEIALYETLEETLYQYDASNTEYEFTDVIASLKAPATSLH